MEKGDGKHKYREKDNIKVYLNIYEMQTRYNWFR
jgi:hypothetical protein